MPNKAQRPPRQSSTLFSKREDAQASAASEEPQAAEMDDLHYLGGAPLHELACEAKIRGKPKRGKEKTLMKERILKGMNIPKTRKQT